MNDESSDRIAQLELQLQQERARSAYLESITQNGSASHHPVAPAIARSTSDHGFTTTSANGMEPQPLKRQTRAYSQHSSRAMSNRPDPAHPFRQNGPVASLATPLNRSPPSRDEPTKRSPGGMSSQRLASVHENGPLVGVGIDPADYIANATPDESSYLASTRMSLSPTDMYPPHKQSACPSMYSGSSAHDTSPMTRQNSSFDNVNGNWPTSAPMISSSSSQSMFADHSLWSDSQPSMFSNMSPSNEKQTGTEQNLLLGCGATFPSQEYSPTTFDSNMLFPPESVSMERSTSSTSTSSVRSTSSNLARRARERNEQVLLNSKVTIKPKKLEPSNEDTSAPSKKTKMAVNKSTYSRRKHPRVHCHLCIEHPEFRGEHELQRHINAKHSTTVVKYICRDPASAGLHSNLQPKVPLKGCKSCDSNKLYGAYYNAAAHLRRWHFKPKTGRGKGAKGSSDEKRGGSAGGHWPPMEDLKVWFEERRIRHDQGGVSAEPDDAEEEMVDLGADVAGEITVDTGLGSFGDVNAGFGEVSMSTGMLHSTQVSPELQEFMGYSFADDGSPMWGSGSSNPITPPTYDFYEPRFHG